MSVRPAATTTSYRGHRIRSAPRGPGWTVSISQPTGQPPVVLRNSVPSGLEELLAEAQSRIDRELDGAPWQAGP